MGMLRVTVNVPPIPEAIEAVCEGLVGLNEYILEEAETRGIFIPMLYESGIVYRREPRGREAWESILDMSLGTIFGVHGDGEADCEDLANLRTAELRYYYGEDARTRIGRTARGSFHAVVERGDGTIEDPSRILVNLERQRNR